MRTCLPWAPQNAPCEHIYIYIYIYMYTYICIYIYIYMLMFWGLRKTLGCYNKTRATPNKTFIKQNRAGYRLMPTSIGQRASLALAQHKSQRIPGPLFFLALFFSFFFVGCVRGAPTLFPAPPWPRPAEEAPQAERAIAQG